MRRCKVFSRTPLVGRAKTSWNLLVWRSFFRISIPHATENPRGRSSWLGSTQSQYLGKIPDVDFQRLAFFQEEKTPPWRRCESSLDKVGFHERSLVRERRGNFINHLEVVILKENKGSQGILVGSCVGDGFEMIPCCLQRLQSDPNLLSQKLFLCPRGRQVVAFQRTPFL